MIHTRFEQLSNEELSDLFHSSKWDKMSGDMRLEACQELANRDALEHGMEPREVVAEDLRGLDFGAYDPSDGKIHLNEHVLANGTVMDQQGNETAYPGSNAESMDTIFHENRHAYDAQLSEAVEAKQQGLTYNQAIIDDAQARGLDIDAVRAGDSIYFSAGANHDLYRVQISERGAYEAGQNGTKASFEGSQARLGTDKGYEAYSERLAYGSDGYEEAMKNLSTVYQDENFDKTLDEQMQNIFYNDQKSDDQFSSGTPMSRSAAQGLIRQTNGGQLAEIKAQYGAANEHYTAQSADTAQSANAHTDQTADMEMNSNPAGKNSTDDLEQGQAAQSVTLSGNEADQSESVSGTGSAETEASEESQDSSDSSSNRDEDQNEDC